MSEAASFTEEECTIYIGYIRESSTTTTTETQQLMTQQQKQYRLNLLSRLQ